jgi:hypothetical protein
MAYLGRRAVTGLALCAVTPSTAKERVSKKPGLQRQDETASLKRESGADLRAYSRPPDVEDQRQHRDQKLQLRGNEPRLTFREKEQRFTCREKEQRVTLREKEPRLSLRVPGVKLQPHGSTLGGFEVGVLSDVSCRLRARRIY